MHGKELELRSVVVGPLAENCYLLADPTTREGIAIDPGAEPDKIIEMLNGYRVVAIVLTHAHLDHIGAVNEVRNATGAPVQLHPADAHMLGRVSPDGWLQPGATLALGAHAIQIVHTPGHTPGQVSLLLPGHAIVGDTIFAGGPGRTWCPDDFRTTLATLKNVLLWPDATICHPGHGVSFRLGDILARIERFVSGQHPADFFGDAAW